MVNQSLSRQAWEVGAKVKVGFLTLMVRGAHADSNGGPDIYTLSSLDGARLYEFQPHRGLWRLPEYMVQGTKN